MTEETQTRESRGSRRVAPGDKNRKPSIEMLAFLLLAVYCVAGAAVGVYSSRQRATLVSQQGLTYEANVVSGDTPGKTREQRQKELNSVVEEGILTMSMNVTLFGKTTGADRSINRMVENPFSQERLVRAEVTCDDTEERIFETGAIRLGNYLGSGPLLIPPPIGEYGCTAVFLVYQEETETPMGQAAVKIKLVLQE